MKKYIPSLNGLRALSIGLVILGHLNLNSSDKINFPSYLRIFYDSDFGVNIFFVISGFLITKLLLLEEAENGTISLKNFYIRRVFRIFPAYYFLLFVYFFMQKFSILHFTKASWLSSIFYYKYLSPGDSWDRESGHFWSLSVEEHFYLVWPFVFSFLKKQRIYFLYLIIGLVILFRLNIYFNFLHYSIFYNPTSIFLRGDALMIGCLLALYEGKLTKWLLNRSAIIFNPVTILLLLIFFSSDLLDRCNIQYGLHMGILIIPFGIGSSTGLFCNMLIALLIIVSINYKNRWFNFLNLPFMNYIGKLSYSLYLWQQLFILSVSIGIFNKLPINLICLFVIANFSYYIIEKPFLKFKTRFESKRLVAAI